MQNQSLDVNSMDMDSLSKMIINNPDMLKDLDENMCRSITNKLNPYSKVVGSGNKPVLFSFTNFREDRMNIQKTLSLFMFMNKLIDEHDIWSEDLKEQVKPEERDQFKAHLSLFRDHFLSYSEKKDSTPSSHTGVDPLASLDFISKWQRFETMNFKEIQETLNRNLLYKTNQQCALQVYGTFETQEEARQFIDKHAKTIGFDILMGETNKWVIVQDNDKTIDQIEFVGDQNTLINNMLAKMKEDKQVGEKMLKKRMATKKEENEREHGKHDSSIANVMTNQPNNLSQMELHRKQRLELGEDDILTSDRVENYQNIPILTNDGSNIDKKMI